MATPTSPAPPTVYPSTTSTSNHGARVVIVGGIMLATTTLMIAIATYNRYNARTMHHADSPLILAGAVLDVGCFALAALAVKNGFGRRREELSEGQQSEVRQLFLGSILTFFAAHGFIQISYNLLARHTARTKGFKHVMDTASVAIGCWALANIVVTAVALHSGRSPKRLFFWISGAISIIIVLGQLSAFLWVIWNTQAKTKVKVRWSLSMGAFVPLCIGAIIARLAYTPADYFADNWTLNDVLSAMLFQIELNLMTITVLAPNLPIFFQKTSTGGVFFLPGEANQGSRHDAEQSKRRSVELNKSQWSTYRNPAAFDGKGGETSTSTASRAESNENGKNKSQERKTSFDSDVILMRRSFEIERKETPESSLAGARGPPS